MSRARALKTIRAMGLRAKLTAYGEIRVAYRDNDERSAYYTDDPLDAVATAAHMSERQRMMDQRLMSERLLSAFKVSR